MDSLQWRSFSRELSLAYARDQIERFQRLLERFRLCECHELGGEECNCVNENVREDLIRYQRFIQHRSTQTDEMNGSPHPGLLLQGHDSVAHQQTKYAPTMFDGNRNVLRIAREPLPKDQAYDGIRNPYVLVVNNVNFYGDPRPRNGASHDLKNVERFVKEAGFRSVTRQFDLRKHEMLDLLEQTRQNWELVEHDSFICIIMSHGNEEGILGSDSQAIPVEDITAKFRGGDTCPQLATKPKLFFFQACRGDVDDKGYYVPRGPRSDDVYADSTHFEDMPVKLPSEADFLIAYSTTKGKISHRRFTDDRAYAAQHGERLGSWFISCLVQVLRDNSHKEDLMTMLTRVNKAMSEFYTEGGSKQISCQLSMLTRKVYFANFLNKNSAVAAAV